MPHYVRLILYLKLTFPQLLTGSAQLPVPISQREGPSSRAPPGTPTARTLQYYLAHILQSLTRHDPTHFLLLIFIYWSC